MIWVTIKETAGLVLVPTNAGQESGAAVCHVLQMATNPRLGVDRKKGCEALRWTDERMDGGIHRLVAWGDEFSDAMSTLSVEATKD